MKTTLLNGNARELHFSTTFNSNDEVATATAFERIKNLVNGERGKIAYMEVFGAKRFQKAQEKVFANAPFPVSRILPLDESALPALGGARVCAVAGTNVEYLSTPSGSRVSFYSDGETEFCRSFGIAVNPEISSPYEHSRENMREIKTALALFGFKFTDIVRTWFYNRDILDWYDDFNRARTEYFSVEGIFKGLLPASTGIGAPNLSDTLITSGFVAMRPAKNVDAASWKKPAALESPLQCGATDYGSSFSRAVETFSSRSRRIYVSGSASIALGGKTEHAGDIANQVNLTMRVIAAILESRGMSFADTTGAVAYCLHPEYYAEFCKWLNRNGNIAHVPSYSIVCRSDLLFEVELEASQNDA